MPSLGTGTLQDAEGLLFQELDLRVLITGNLRQVISVGPKPARQVSNIISVDVGLGQASVVETGRESEEILGQSVSPRPRFTAINIELHEIPSGLSVLVPVLEHLADTDSHAHHVPECVRAESNRLLAALDDPAVHLVPDAVGLAQGVVVIVLGRSHPHPQRRLVLKIGLRAWRLVPYKLHVETALDDGLDEEETTVASAAPQHLPAVDLVVAGLLSQGADIEQ